MICNKFNQYSIKSGLCNEVIFWEPLCGEYVVTLLPWKDNEISFKMRKFNFDNKIIYLPIIPILIEEQFYIWRLGKLAFENLCSLISSDLINKMSFNEYRRLVVKVENHKNKLMNRYLLIPGRKVVIPTIDYYDGIKMAKLTARTIEEGF